MAMDNMYKIRETLVDKIQKFCFNQGFHKVVIGMSGGKDSTVAAALCARALGESNVYGLIMPDGEQKDINDAITACKILKIPYDIINIKNLHEEFLDSVEKLPYNKESDINVVPRLRMTILRYYAQTMNALVCGTGNLSELTVGYFTLHGDGSYDFNPLGALTSLEVQELGDTLALPSSLVWKTPADGLSGQTDEERLGVSYQAIHNYLRHGYITKEDVAKIEKMRDKTSFKRHMPMILDWR